MDTWLNNTPLFSYFLRPLADIAALAVIFYKIYETIAKSRALQALRGVMGMLFVVLVAYVFKLDTLLWLFKAIGPLVLVAIAVIFQPELRKMFAQVGKAGWFREAATTSSRLDSVLNAAEALAQAKRGALIVFARSSGLKSVIETGTKLDAELTSSLLRTIFGHNTPMHDGAVVILNGRVAAAGCFLPLSKQEGIKRSFGTRHRAALGLTEETDAVALIVSEETGAISLAYDGALYYDRGIDGVRLQLRNLLHVRDAEQKKEEE